MALGDGEETGGCWTPKVLLVDCELCDEVEIADLMTKHQRLSSHHILTWQDEEETGLVWSALGTRWHQVDISTYH